MPDGERKEMNWKETVTVLSAGACGVLLTLRFTELNPGWGSMAGWPAAAWISGCLALACIAGFLAAVYRCYLKRRYGRFAPCMLAAFIVMHAAVALLIMNRLG